MASLPTQTFDQIVTNLVTAIQGATSAFVDFAVGSVLRAIAQATAGLTLWLQAIALQIASLTRFATSSASDADSWGADFNFPRLAAQAATGAVTFSRFTPTAQASIGAGTVVQTADGTVQFTVIADTTQSAWNAAQNAYVLGSGVASCTATVEAVTAGSAANVATGALNTLSTAISGVDTVTNAAPFDNGDDAESDASYRARFPSYLASLAKATRAAVLNAATSVQQGITATLTENQAY
ncbi:MAG: baseplate J/gp47 family protein, partial [Steroidobacteraceae bacterium]